MTPNLFRVDKPAYYLEPVIRSWLDPDSWWDSRIPSPVPHTQRYIDSL